MKKTIIATLCGLLVVGSANAHEARTMSNSDGLKVEVKLLDFEKGDKSIGYVTISESKYGLVFTPELTGLTAGLHGFHLHEKPSCAAGEKDGKKANGLGAGGHLNTNNGKYHGFPWDDDAHLGDLPALTVNADGTATNPVLAPRLKSLNDVKNRSIMIHVGGDNYSDKPAALGGGGGRMACGVIK